MFGWKEWTQCFAEIARANERAPGISEATAYWRNWVLTLERMLVAHGVASDDVLHMLTDAWDEAFHTTPHAQPVLLPEEVTRGLAAPTVVPGTAKR